MRKLIFQTLPFCLILGLMTQRESFAVLTSQPPPRIQTVELKGFVYSGNRLVETLTVSSANYSSHFDADGLGSFGWSFTNTTGATLQNLRFVVFLDADIDRETNTFFNEHGSLIGLALPVGAPAGAIAASSWEIDEPGFLFGDIAQHLENGELDNNNAVPESDRNDVSLALGFQAGALQSGATINFTFSLGQTNIGGLLQTDSDSNFSFYFNGYARAVSGPPAITPTTITRQQGSPGAVSTVARVSDDLTPAGDLTMTLRSAPAGIAVTGLTNDNGVISANVAAACTAAIGANTVVLQVADSDGQTKTGELTVNVTANTPPLLGAYPATVAIGLGASLTVSPAAPPIDNGTITAITVSAPGFAGSLSVNPSTGIVAVSNAGPLGSHTVTIRVTDNCGAMTESVFRLDVVKPAETCGLTASAPAMTRGFTQTNDLPEGDWFLLQGRFKQSIVSQVNGAAAFTVDQANFGDGVPGLPGLGLEGWSFSGQNATTRVISCEDSLSALSLLLAGNGNTADDVVRLFLQTPNGSATQELAQFTMQSGGARVTQLNPNLKLYLNNRSANGAGQLGVGDFIPISAPAGTSGVRSGLLTLAFSADPASPLSGCFQLGMDVRRGAGVGAMSVVFTEVLVNRLEQPGDRNNAGSGLLGGLGGGFPTGQSCAGVCPLCSSGQCIAICFRSPQYYGFFLDRLIANTHLGGQSVFIGGVNTNQPVGIQNSIPLIRLALRGGNFVNLPPATPLQRLNQGFVAAQLSLALAGGQGSAVAYSALMGRLGCYRGLVNFGPVRLSNGVTLTPDSMLAELFEQARFAIQEKRTADMDALAGVFVLLNGNDPLGRCR